MSYFPLMVNFDNRDILVVGAGNVAAFKISKLLMFGPRLTVIAREALPEVVELAQQSKLKLELRDFRMEDLAGRYIVLVAVDDESLQREIKEVCSQKGILCNCVDVPELCDFIFPALIKKDLLTIAISTGGNAPYMARYVKETIARELPENLSEIVEKVASFRSSKSVLQEPDFESRKARVIEYATSLLRQESLLKVDKPEDPSPV